MGASPSAGAGVAGGAAITACDSGAGIGGGPDSAGAGFAITACDSGAAAAGGERSGAGVVSVFLMASIWRATEPVMSSTLRSTTASRDFSASSSAARPRTASESRRCSASRRSSASASNGRAATWVRSLRPENRPAMRWVPTSLRVANTATNSAPPATPPQTVMRHRCRMVNVALVGRFGGGTGFAAGLLPAVPALRSVPDSKIRGRIIVEN
jgi:hypothetical protein